ncbi:hypothetical protein [Nocardioides sp. URHA0020]|uniref:hypothetical protein n=1 Tax=Nocardioides sp. URHA0020 TaxID=1380392 RepID=UPI0012DCC37F|nr:hypothetical protein [Nocardioides sp. URHA0020]
MTQSIYGIIEAALALTRPERAMLVERLQDSLVATDVAGGTIVAPQDLVDFGARYEFPSTTRSPRETVTLTAIAGPVLSMRWGAITITDPWRPQAVPQTPDAALGPSDHPTVLTAIARTDTKTGTTDLQPVAAAIGAVAEVTAWHPLPAEGQFQLDSDSSLGAFYEIYEAPDLQPLFEDAEYMQGIFNRALEELIVPLEVGGRTAAAVFLCPKDLHPAWIGYDANGSGVAVLLDFGILALARGKGGQ